MHGLQDSFVTLTKGRVEMYEPGRYDERKFIAIAAGLNRLFALDVEGNVWSYEQIGPGPAWHLVDMTKEVTDSL